LLNKHPTTKLKEVKPDAVWQNLVRKAMAQKGAVFPMMMMIMSL
jgi:hypothetical protein